MRIALTLLTGFVLATAVGATEVEDAAMPASVVYGYGSDTSDSMQGQLKLAPSIEIAFDQATTLDASARLRMDIEDELEPGRADTGSFAAASRPMVLGETGTLELRDFYLSFRSDDGVARFGKQQIVWGRLDGIKVLDVINPQDFREFILDDFGESRIGLWSAYFDYSFGKWRTELAIVPDGTGHAIPRPGAWFELTAPRFRFGAEPGEASLPVVTDRPGHGIDDTGAGLRLSRQIAAFEVSAVAYTGIDPEPLGRVVTQDAETVLERYYERRTLYGFSAEAGFGPTVLRAEYAYQPDRTFNIRSEQGLGTAALDQHRGVLALDISGPLDVFINVQYLVDAVQDAPDTLVRPETDRIGTLFLKRRFGYDKLDLTLRWYHSFSDNDDLASVAVEYGLASNTTLTLGVETFRGDADGIFGQFDGSDRVTLGIEHTF